MSARRPDARASLEAWRDAGADGFDPARFARMEALARRAASQPATVRAVLDARLDALVDAYAAALDRGPVGASAAVDLRPSTLAALLERFAQRSGRPDRTSAILHSTPHAPDTGVLAEVVRLCSEAQSESRLRQAMVQPPADAGPLNSASLVHRALRLMQSTSPAYLRAMLSHVEALAWIEDMPLAPAPGGRTAQAGAASTKRRRTGSGRPRA